MARNWYAVELDEEDLDWGDGSFDFDQAVRMAKANNCTIIAEIDGAFDDETGEATTDPICVAIYRKGEDF